MYVAAIAYMGSRKLDCRTTGKMMSTYGAIHHLTVLIRGSVGSYVDCATDLQLLQIWADMKHLSSSTFQS